MTRPFSVRSRGWFPTTPGGQMGVVGTLAWMADLDDADVLHEAAFDLADHLVVVWNEADEERLLAAAVSNRSLRPDDASALLRRFAMVGRFWSRVDQYDQSFKSVALMASVLAGRLVGAHDLGALGAEVFDDLVGSTASSDRAAAVHTGVFASLVEQADCESHRRWADLVRRNPMDLARAVTSVHREWLGASAVRGVDGIVGCGCGVLAEALTAAVGRGEAGMLEMLAGVDPLPDDLVGPLAAHPSAKVRAAVAGRASVSAAQIEAALADGAAAPLLSLLTRQPDRLTDEQWVRAAAADRVTCREKVAEQLPVRLMLTVGEALAMDPSAKVRDALRRRRDLPRDVRGVLWVTSS